MAAQDAHAQSNWNGGSGNWNVDANWTPNRRAQQPLHRRDDHRHVRELRRPSRSINLSPSVHNLSLDSFSTLTIQRDRLSRLRIEHQQCGSDRRRHQRQFRFTCAIAASSVTLSGGGTISLNDPTSFLIGTVNGNETLVNQDNTIQGQGSIFQLASFQNQGTVNANVSGKNSSSKPRLPTVTNDGTMEATGGGS